MSIPRELTTLIQFFAPYFTQGLYNLVLKEPTHEGGKLKIKESVPIVSDIPRLVHFIHT